MGHPALESATSDELTRNRRAGQADAVPMNPFPWSPRIAQYPSIGEIPLS